MRTLLPLLTLLLAFGGNVVAQTVQVTPEPDVIYVPTPQPVVDEMLKLAGISNRDTVYDLGSGDGRIVITAARRYGARGFGIDIDPVRITESNANAVKDGVTDRVKFIQGDLFEVDLRPATAVTLYLLGSLNLRLRPKLLEELRPGTPIVSHDFDMGDWEPDATVVVDASKIYLWRVPADVDGEWELTLKDRQGERRLRLSIDQSFQKIAGVAETDAKVIHGVSGRIDGVNIDISLGSPDGGSETSLLAGRIGMDEMDGTFTTEGNPEPSRGSWKARRTSMTVQRSR